jgi:hypothetical protein
MEDKVVTISRALGSVTFPANFMLVGISDAYLQPTYPTTALLCFMLSGKELS